MDGDKDKMQADADKQRISDLRTKRGVVQMQLTKMKKFLETPGRSLQAAELQTRLSLVEGFWSKFEDLQTKLECLDEEELQGDKREAFQDSFIAVKAQILGLLEPKTVPSPSSPNTTLDATVIAKRNVRLPSISIKKFSGRHVDWPDFYAKFKVLIENDEELSDVEKMSYLQESLEERPLKQISNLSLDRDFANAIATLKARYENKRLIYQAHIHEIVEVKPISKPSEDDLRNLVDVVESSLRALQKLATQKEIFEGILLHIVRLKLDGVSRSKWDDEMPAGTYPTWDEFASFIERRSRSLETKAASCNIPVNVPAKMSSAIKPTKAHYRKALIVSKADSTCWFCKKAQHRIEACDAFSKLSASDRFQQVKAMKRCILCLQPGHAVKHCNSSSCEECKKRHHTLLHFGQIDSSDSHPMSNITPPKAGSAMTAQLGSVQGLESAFLATAIVLVKGSQGNYIPCRALLDSGSSLNLIVERVVQHLRLKKVRSEVQIGGVGSTSLAVKHKTHVSIMSTIGNYTASFEAYILPTITGHQPSQIVPTDNWRVPDNITLADPKYNIPQPIDLLIGANLFFELLSVGQIRLGNGLPTLQKTVLGWIISGGKGSNEGSYHASLTRPSDPEDGKLEELVQRFWSVDNPQSQRKLLSPEQQACEEHFVGSVKRNEAGRFTVKLPFRRSPSCLGASLDIAKKRFFNLEQKLSKSPQVKEQYQQFMKEYLDLGHMEMVPFQDIPQGHYFMPHHCVLKPQSSSTKLRVVFDASCKTTSGISLNEALMVGPVIQDDLYTLLIRFRSYKYALTADISKMYRQIVVRHPDTNYQYILWRNDPREPVQAYRLLTLTYGTSPASFIATRCLKKLANDEKDSFPLGSSVVEHDFYVDDMLTGADSLGTVMAIQEEVTKLLAAGGFKLSKWCANAPELLSSIEESHQEKYISIDGDNVIKTLGMMWSPRNDKIRFSYNSQAVNNSRITKRTVLAAIARLFDPIGLLSPIITKAKIFLQEIWKIKLNWDESLPQGLQQQWLTFFAQLEAVKGVEVPRHVVDCASSIEIHGFADASMDAYGCCIYSRFEDGSRSWCNLITARSRVAPLQTQSIARLELCAALLLAESISRVVEVFDHKFSKVVCWSDSNNVLTWLSSSPSRWSVFVSNRVRKIQELTKNYSWRHIGTENNPADIVSRGALPLDLVRSSLWFHGPSFLLLPEENWPNTSAENDMEVLEERKTRTVLKVSISDNWLETHKYRNSYLKLVNMVAYMFRFVNNAQRGSIGNRLSGPLSVQETDHALQAIIRSLQKHYLNDDYRKLSGGCAVSNKSALKALDPFVDNNGLIRVGGRLSNSNIEEDQKHPIVLPKTYLAKSLIFFYHCRNLHAGCQTLLAIVRSRFWPIGGRVLVKGAISRCIRCFRCRPKVAEQIMGQLPVSRLQPGPVFGHTGVDFCGPFYIKGPIRNRPPTKAYLCIFVCMAVKATHLEVVGDLSSEAFLSALTKFIARRSQVAKIYSDNATNFIGARRELQELEALFQSESHSRLVHEMCRKDGIEWITIPVRSPNFGGLWEGAVKQAKYLLKRALGIEAFTLDEMQRMACQVESILNSRPITPLSNDPRDLEVLTPGHFLTGGMMRAIPAPTLHDIKTNRLNRWQLIQSKMQTLWSRWRKEYLQELQRRVKWQVKKPNLCIGMMVLLKDESVPPLKWPLGRIVKIHQGEDQLVRVVTVRTIAGDTTRAISKVCPLPLEDHHLTTCLEPDASKEGGYVNTA